MYMLFWVAVACLLSLLNTCIAAAALILAIHLSGTLDGELVATIQAMLVASIGNS